MWPARKGRRVTVAALMRDLADAVAVLTAVPVPRDAARAPARTAVGWFPLVGLALGASVASPLAVPVVRDAAARAPLLAAGALMVLSALLTRMIHLDGLADVADAWWSGADAGERLRIMRDPAVGAFGVCAIVLTLLVQASALSVLIAVRSYPPLLLGPAVGRTAILFACWFGEAARPDGLGRTFIGPPPGRAVAGAGVSVVVIAVLTAELAGVHGLAMLIPGVVLAALVPHTISKRFGGVTGDVMGASAVIVETAFYAVVALSVKGT